MKILLFSDQYYPLGGGIEQYLKGLGGELSRQGHEITILTRSIEGCPEREETSEGLVVRTPLLLDAIPDPWKVLGRWRELTPLIERINPDVIFANHHTSLAAICASRQAGIPVIYGCHGWGLLCPLKIRLLRPNGSLCYNERGLKNCLQCLKDLRMRSGKNHWVWRVALFPKDCVTTWRKVARFDYGVALINAANARIANSQLTASLFPTANTYAIHLGVDGKLYYPTDAKAFLKINGIKDPYVFVPGRLVPVKGHEWAIHALSLMPKEFNMVIAGGPLVAKEGSETSYVRRLKKLVSMLHLEERVFWVGDLDLPMLREAYSGAVATIVPSVWLESFGYVTVESMACETPVVVTQNCGSAEIVEDGKEGFVIPRMQAKEIADAVMRINAQRQLMGRRARGKVLRELCWPLVAYRVLEVFNSVCCRQPKGNEN
jgi:glycosyltransferase involved in cell wall biosynthesis